MKSPIKGLLKNIFLVVIIFVFLGAIFSIFNVPSESPEKVSITQLAEDINQGKVKEIKIINNDITVTYSDDKTAESKKETGGTLGEALVNYGASTDKIKNVSFVFEEEDKSWEWVGTFFMMVILPFLLFGVFFF
ncbi:MAG: ATP-dependent metallopeptidase FtsH/Yme1/Tma family protein, partial [Candidatus Pacebacteria bacterium]|nr:ATP-dependent metallopeptidase FtsH/Yme1/Tma family protein [Candidatus Paceibacterota bacterium]